MSVFNILRINLMKNTINFNNSIIRLILFFISLDSTLNYCNNRSEPILLKESNECVMKYCTEENFKNNICIIDNDIIRTQWLNNIINFGDENCRFTKIAKYSNGDMVAISQINPGDSYAAYFYGLKENGRPLFIKNGKETPYNPLNNYIISQYDNFEYDESEVLVVKNKTNGKEFILILGRLSNFTEFYNFDNNIDSQQSVYNLIPFFSPDNIINNVRGSLFYLKNSNYFLYGGTFTFTRNYNRFFNLFKLYYEDNNILIGNTSTEMIHSRGGMASCFETEDCAYIICFYLCSLSSRTYKIIIFDKNLNKITPELIIFSNIIEENIFFKCIHYQENKGIFIYYDKINDEGPYPIILFKAKKNQTIINWDSLTEIKINYSYIFEYNANLNDFIKISNEFICFSSVSQEKDILYIVMINIFDNESKVKIRYYLIRTFELYNYKFYLDLRLNIYKESIILTSSYCNQKDCEEGNTHYSSLIIFSYPNSTDYSKNIVDELFEKNVILENLNINLSLRKNVTIENNIFGLIYSQILIKTIQNCDNVELTSSNSKSSITPNYTLEKDEDINITFNNNDIFNCSIGYIFGITEPDYDEFEKYPENIDISYGNDNKDNFNNNKKTYFGRLSYYSLYLNDKLTTNCTFSCRLCYDNEEKECIVCNSNYTLKIESNGLKKKICSGQENEETEISSYDLTYNISSNKLLYIITESPTEEITETHTEKIIDNSIENISDKLTNEIIDELTEIINASLSDKITENITEIITDKSTYNIKDKLTDKIIDKITEQIDCKIEEIMSSQCTNGTVKDGQFQDLSNQFKNKYLNKDTNDRESKKIKTENVVLEITNIDKQDENDPSISYLDLGECEEILKSVYSIPEDESLILYKEDIKSHDLTTTYVQYEIFNPITLEPLDYLTHCSKEKVSISIPVNLNNNTQYLYDSLNSSGYNLFDSNDSFYNDICAVYTTENGTDINLNDRQHVIEDSGTTLNFCQVGCTMIGYNNKTQKAVCNCNIQETKNVSNINDILFPTELLTNIFEGFKYSNYLVMKCYKLLYNFELIKKNKGFIIMMVIFILLLILLLIYIIKGKNKILYYIQAVLKNKSVYIKNRKSLFKTISNKILNINKIKKKSKNSDATQTLNKSKINENNKKLNQKRNSYEPPIKKSKIKSQKKNFENLKVNDSLKNLGISNQKLRNEMGINIVPIHDLNSSKNKKENQNLITKKNLACLYKFNNQNNDDENETKLKKNKKSKKILDLEHINYQTLNIQELNNLEYKIAILIDKRTFIQYYCALIRKKQLIIFTFVPTDDYNLLTLKISSFLLQFSLYMTVNAFFFSDSTMHQIYANNGNESILYHIPQIIYSSLISTVFNAILRQLSLSENDILSIKKARFMKVSNKRANEVKVYLRIKIIIFFIVSFILTIFFWYFISCFCAVYTNTQIILIKDSLLSFGLSMLYPFGINIIPTIFRISSLRSRKEDKLCLYKTSQLLSLI